MTGCRCDSARRADGKACLLGLDLAERLRAGDLVHLPMAPVIEAANRVRPFLQRGKSKVRIDEPPSACERGLNDPTSSTASADAEKPPAGRRQISDDIFDRKHSAGDLDLGLTARRSFARLAKLARQECSNQVADWITLGFESAAKVCEPGALARLRKGEGAFHQGWLTCREAKH